MRMSGDQLPVELLWLLDAPMSWFAKAEAEARAEYTRGRDRGQERTLRPVSNSHRHLLALALHYASSDALKDRVLLADTRAQTVRTAADAKHEATVWRDEKYVTA